MYLNLYLDELNKSIPKTTNDITHNSDNGSVELNVYLEELKNSVSDGKQLVADAITTISNVYTRNTDTFATMAANVLELKSFSQYYYLQYNTAYNKYNNTVKNVMTNITNAGYNPFLWYSTSSRVYIRIGPYATNELANVAYEDLLSNNINTTIIDPNTNDINL